MRTGTCKFCGLTHDGPGLRDDMVCVASVECELRCADAEIARLKADAAEDRDALEAQKIALQLYRKEANAVDGRIHGLRVTIDVQEHDVRLWRPNALCNCNEIYLQRALRKMHAEIREMAKP